MNLQAQNLVKEQTDNRPVQSNYVAQQLCHLDPPGQSSIENRKFTTNIHNMELIRIRIVNNKQSTN